MSTNLPPGMGAMDIPGARSTWECPHCSTEWPHEVERRECSVCGRTACIECLEDCECGCGKDAHQSCMVHYGNRSVSCSAWLKGSKRMYWLRKCLEIHIEKLEQEAADSLREAEQAKQAIRRAA